jgi:energy-coupling factor transporter ATP-binding protein EcfA2
VAQVRLDRVSKRFGAEPAVDNVSFTAEAGTLVVLLGPSGCGKSTTLRLIAGLEAADERTVEIAGRDVTRAPAARRGMSMVIHISPTRCFRTSPTRVPRQGPHGDRISFMARARGMRTRQPRLCSATPCRVPAQKDIATVASLPRLRADGRPSPIGRIVPARFTTPAG